MDWYRYRSIVIGGEVALASKHTAAGDPHHAEPLGGASTTNMTNMKVSRPTRLGILVVYVSRPGDMYTFSQADKINGHTICMSKQSDRSVRVTHRVTNDWLLVLHAGVFQYYY